MKKIIYVLLFIQVIAACTKKQDPFPIIPKYSQRPAIVPTQIIPPKPLDYNHPKSMGWRYVSEYPYEMREFYYNEDMTLQKVYIKYNTLYNRPAMDSINYEYKNGRVKTKTKTRYGTTTLDVFIYNHFDKIDTYIRKISDLNKPPYEYNLYKYFYDDDNIISHILHYNMNYQLLDSTSVNATDLKMITYEKISPFNIRFTNFEQMDYGRRYDSGVITYNMEVDPNRQSPIYTFDNRSQDVICTTEQIPLQKELILEIYSYGITYYNNPSFELVFDTNPYYYLISGYKINNRIYTYDTTNHVVSFRDEIPSYMGNHGSMTYSAQEVIINY